MTVVNFNWRMPGDASKGRRIISLRVALVATFLVLLALLFAFPFSGAMGSPLIQLITPTLPPPINQPPVATAAFNSIDVSGNGGTFEIVATAIDPDNNLDSVIAVMETPSVAGLDVELKIEDRIKAEFDLDEGFLEIKGPDPQAILAQIEQMGGLLIQNGQIANIELHEDVEKSEFKFEDENSLKIEASQATLRVMATDKEGESNTATASLNFNPSEDDQDGEKENKRKGNNN